MALRVNVPGAADSGKVRGKKPPHGDWTCSNGHPCKGYWTRCLTVGCNEKRP